MNSNANLMNTVYRASRPAHKVASTIGRAGSRELRSVITQDSSVRSANHVLAALPLAEWRHLEQHMECVDVPFGASLYQAGAPLRHVYFPTTAIISLVSSMKDGASAEVAVVGNEGVVGVGAFLGGGRALSGAVVQSAGHAWRISAETIARHAWQSEIVMQPLLRYTQALFTHMAQTSACSQHHALDQKLCRWLLLSLDRHSGNEIVATQEQIAGMLGVRREGVTSNALKLQRAGLIQYRRGRMSVLDRAGLEERSCECYSVVRQAYDRLWSVPPAGSGRRTSVDEGGLQRATA